MILKRHYPRYSALFFVVAAFAVISCKRSEYQQNSGLIWNTSYHITYAGPPSLSDSILSVLEGVGRSLNVFDSTSLVSRANRSESIVVDSHFRNVYQASVKANKASDGMFDPTLSPLITAWGFGPGHTPTADTMNIAGIMERVGIDKTHLNGDTLVKDNPDICFNFSAVAKGYACDAVAAMLRRNEVTDYLVEIGGEIAMGGVSPGRDMWKVSIDAPLESDSLITHDSSAILRVTDAGMATSGNYRNFRKENGRTLGHTISPKTGRPVTTDVVSATVIAPNAMDADAAATACMASGSEAAKKMIETLGYDALLILADSTVWTTPGIKNALVVSGK